MKKVLAVLLACLTLFGTAACQRKTAEDITTVTITDHDAAVRDLVFEAKGIIGKTEEECLTEYVEQVLPALAARTEQTFPDEKVSHPLNVIRGEMGDTYTLTGNREDCIVLYIHGGAWATGIQPEHVSFCDQLVDALGATVYMPLYPLIPQADYEDGIKMVESVYTELLKKDKPIIVMGDSAGGNLAMGFVLYLKDKGMPLPDKMTVMAPCADISFSNPEIEEYAKVDGVLSPATCRYCGNLWRDGEDAENPYVSPLYGDYKDFPDTFMILGTCDIIYPDARKLFDKMTAAGVKTKLLIGDGFWHVFPIYDINEQDQIIGMIRDFCK